MRLTRAASANALLGLLTGDFLLVLITGDRSILLLGGRIGFSGVLLRAVVLGILCVACFRFPPRRDERMGRARLLLLLLLLPTLVQFQLLGSRLSGDGTSYYVFLRSLMKDRDFDLVNEYTHYGAIGREHLKVTTNTGLRSSAFSVGPAVVWTPFFMVGEGVARAQSVLTGQAVDLSGYGRHHVNAVALGSLLYGFAAILLVHALLLRYFAPPTSLLAVLLMWGATFCHWYMVVQPAYAHTTSMLFTAYALWLWDRDREGSRGAWGSFYLGVVLGLGMCVRSQNGVLLILPGIELAARLWKNPRAFPRLTACAALLAAGVILGVFPQMAAWKALYDTWTLPCPPQGCDFVRLDHPWVLEALFSSRHGLFSWTPVFWAGYLGFLPLWRRRPTLAALLAAPLLLTSYVNVCAGDWWAGASFSNRRFDGVLPLVAFGFAASVDTLRTLVGRRPSLALALVAVPLALWNVTLLEQVRRGLVNPGSVAPFPRLAGNAATVVSDAVGFPTTWPASWLFAWQHGLSPGRYDVLVGRYLFYRQNSLGPRLDLDAPLVAPMLDDGWGAIETVEGVRARCAFGRARVFVPLDVPEELAIRFRATSPAGKTDAGVFVNGRAAGRFAATTGWSRAGLRVATVFWRRELNEVAVEPQAGSVCVASMELVRNSRRKGRP